MAKILVVDDRPINLQMLGTLLGYRKHNVLEARDGLEGLEAAEKALPDLIITDIVMPRMDGNKFAAEVRANPLLAHTPIIFYTASSMANQAKALSQQVGESYVMTKPTEPEVILQMVDTALAAKPTPVSPALATPSVKDPAKSESDSPVRDIEKRLEQLEASTGRMAAIIELGLELSLAPDPLRLGRKFVDVSRQILASRWVALNLIESNNSRMESLWSTEGDETSVPPQAYVDWFNQMIERGDSSRGGRTEENMGPGYESVQVLKVPIVESASYQGHACFFEKLDAPTFTDEDERIAVTLGAMLATAHERIRLHEEVKRRAAELQESLARVKQLQGMLPICSYCKRIRDDKNYWRQVETYIAAHSEALFSHSVCPECYEKYITPQLEQARSPGEEDGGDT